MTTANSTTTVPVFTKTILWGSRLWTDGFYYGSAGTVSAHTIAMYIANQKKT